MHIQGRLSRGTSRGSSAGTECLCKPTSLGSSRAHEKTMKVVVHAESPKESHALGWSQASHLMQSSEFDIPVAASPPGSKLSRKRASMPSTKVEKHEGGISQEQQLSQHLYAKPHDKNTILIRAATTSATWHDGSNGDLHPHTQCSNKTCFPALGPRPVTRFSRMKS